MNYYLDVMKKYVVFEGRARRKEYWMFYLINFCISIVLGIIGNMIKFPFISMLYSLAIILPSIALAIRRMHDIGKSGVWILVSLIPVIGWIWFIILAVKEGEPGTNEYGEDPKM